MTDEERDIFDELIEMLAKTIGGKSDGPPVLHAIAVDTRGRHVGFEIKGESPPEGYDIEDLDDQFHSVVEHYDGELEALDSGLTGELSLAALAGTTEFVHTTAHLEHLVRHLKEWGLNRDQVSEVCNIVDQMIGAADLFQTYLFHVCSEISGQMGVPRPVVTSMVSDMVRTASTKTSPSVLIMKVAEVTAQKTLLIGSERAAVDVLGPKYYDNEDPDD